LERARHTPYEFGCKVSVATTNARAPGGQFVTHMKAFHGNPYDGHTLKEVIAEMEDWTGIEVERIYLDKGYQGHNYPNKFKVYKSGQKRGITPTIKKELRRRSAIEAVIGHMKTDGRLGRNFLKGRVGDKINAILVGAGYNYRLVLKWLRLLFALIMRALFPAGLQMHIIRP
jgi:IS5 family transposase